MPFFDTSTNTNLTGVLCDEDGNYHNVTYAGDNATAIVDGARPSAMTLVSAVDVVVDGCGCRVVVIF